MMTSFAPDPSGFGQRRMPFIGKTKSSVIAAGSGRIANIVAGVGVAMLLTACATSNGGNDTKHEEAVAQDPAAMMRIAEAAEADGDLPSASAFYQRAATLQPELVAAQIGAARTLAQQGNLVQAIGVLHSAHMLMPQDAELTKTFGRLLVVAGRPADAVVVFDEGLAIAPQSTAFLIGKGVALNKLGRHPEAQEAYRAALAIDPNDATAQHDLALSKKLAAEALTH